MNDTSSSSRKLAAILAADAAGYSRLMAADEAGTITALNEARAVFRRHIENHRGRVVDTAGDSVLAEFSSPIEAVGAASAIQQDLEKLNAELPEERRMQFRIGINLGDVIEDKGAIYGDGVNVAARLQELADAGGICISGTVFDQVEGKLPLSFKSIGEQRVRKLSKPVRAYQTEHGHRKRRTRNMRLLAAIGIAICAAGLAIDALWLSRSAPAPAADPAYTMPSGPVIAVLPFTNLSGDPKQDYFSDGLTEDIITELARFKDFYVLARNITAQYKAQPVDIADVVRKLGARYVLEGSVRRAGHQVRITAQLIDGPTGTHIWAEKYDRDMHDIFILQDEITNRIVATITGGSQSVLRSAARASAGMKDSEQLKAYEHVLQAGAFTAFWSLENYRLAKRHLEKAIELAPGFARARHVYAYTLLLGWISHFEESPAPPVEIIRNAVKSVELDPGDYRAQRTAAVGYFFSKRLELFDHHARLALAAGPNDAEMLAELGALYTFTGQWDRGVALVIKANNLNPATASGWYHSALHYDFFRKGQFREALEIVMAHHEQHILHTQWKYVAAYAELGEIGKAREHFEKCRTIDPTWSADRMGEELRLWNLPEPLIKQYLQSYAKAGYFTTQKL
ncbi:MAG: adenylate/guanylate cyclase domain-containing protein [Burkholderiales bacterium]